jgi:hypothetical protein
MLDLPACIRPYHSIILLLIVCHGTTSCRASGPLLGYSDAHAMLNTFRHSRKVNAMIIMFILISPEKVKQQFCIALSRGSVSGHQYRDSPWQSVQTCSSSMTTDRGTLQCWEKEVGMSTEYISVCLLVPRAPYLLNSASLTQLPSRTL